MSSAFDDETWERELFARRAATDLAPDDASALDLGDVLDRIDARNARTGAISVGRVLTLANAFAAAAACLALLRGLPAERNGGAVDRAGEDGPNMTMISAGSSEGERALACVAGEVARGEMCSMPTSGAVTTFDSPSSLASSSIATLSVETLSCVDAVTCGAVGP